MQMYANNNNNVSYVSNSDNMDDNYPLCPSTASSFSSDTSSASWESEMLLLTPTSTPRGGSPNFVKSEGTSSHVSTPSYSSHRYDQQNAFCSNLPVSHDLMPGFSDPNAIFQADHNMGQEHAMIDYQNFGSYNMGGLDNHNMVCDPFQNHSQQVGMEPPALNMDLYSPESATDSSTFSEDFVIPSETTFMDTFDLQSPMTPYKSLQFDIAYDSPTSMSAFDQRFGIDDGSDAGSMQCYMSTYSDPKQEIKSQSTTPSRSSPLRPTMYDALPTTAALQRAQCVKREDTGRNRYRDSKAFRDGSPPSRIRRAKKEARSKEVLSITDHTVLSNIRLQKSAKKECTYKNCGRRFQRQEHLKRHEKTHEGTEVHRCEFCLKFIGRSDNLKMHIKLHAEPPNVNKKSRRTDYFEGAQAVVDAMQRKQRKGVGGLEAEEQGLPVRTGTIQGY